MILKMIVMKELLMVKTHMKFNIRHMDWFKRRSPVKQIQPVKVDITGLQLVDNHYCDMDVLYDDGNTYRLNGRVMQNDITKKWTVHGLNPHGLSVLVDIVED